MNTSNEYTGRSLWLAASLLPFLMVGCNSSNDEILGGGDPVMNGVAPTVVSTTPLDAADNVAINNLVTATFSEGMDDTTIDSLSFTVIGFEETALVGSISYAAGSNTATFTPDSNFSATTVYTATLTTQIESTEGVALASDYEWTFTSADAADETAPTVLTTMPLNGAGSAAINTNIVANFSEALSPTTVNDLTFTVTGDGGSVAGAVSYSNKTATFNPTDDLAGGIEYTATLTMAITDQAVPGNPLAADYIWTFTTGSVAALGPAAVNLRTAGDFAILSKAGITDVPSSPITGNIGASPITAAAIHVTCEEMASGLIYGSNTGYVGSGNTTCFRGVGDDITLVANAVLDMGTAYADAKGRSLPDFTELGDGDISGLTLVPGLYKWGTGVEINSDVTLAGGANDVWIFQVSGDITLASDTSVLLDGGALPQNIFWQVGGGTGVALGTSSVFEGVIMAEKAITLNTLATVHGRLLSQTEVTLIMNTVTEPSP